ncbi:hypothetical protein BaRGS_00024590, partial [Batillaria attramentaria]
APAFLNPDFNEITLPSGDDAEKEFPVRTHTTEFQDCVLFKLTSDTQDDGGSLDKLTQVFPCT